MAKDDLANRRRIADLEIRLNEAETAIASEAHVLLIWRGRERPCRTGSWAPCMARRSFPSEPEVLLDFRHWLDRDSAVALIECLHELRQRRHALQHRHQDARR